MRITSNGEFIESTFMLLYEIKSVLDMRLNWFLSN